MTIKNNGITTKLSDQVDDTIIQKQQQQQQQQSQKPQQKQSPNQQQLQKRKRITLVPNKPSLSKYSERRLVEYFVVVSSVPKVKTTATDYATTNTHSSLCSDSSDSRSSGFQWGSRMSRDAVDDIGDDCENNDGDNDNDDKYFADYEPVITSRYPLDDHDGNPLQENLICFCFPSGRIEVKTNEGYGPPCMPKVHYFVMTGDKGLQNYGICLTVYEPVITTPTTSGDNDSTVSNKSGGDSGDDGDDDASPSQPSSSSQSSPPPSPERTTDEIANNNSNSVPKKSSKSKIIYAPKCICIISAYPYLVAFREYLVQLHRLSETGEMTVPIESYITNFCSEIPAPPPGSFEVQVTILDSVLRFWSPPSNQPIAWVSLPFRHLFECLDVHNVYKIWHALLLERQVLITCTQLSLLTTICEILVSLLFPMRWSHAYIPVLPSFLLSFLSAPMPFLCGIDKTLLSDAVLDLSNECIVVDLDTNQVTMGPTTPYLPPLPTSVSKAILTDLSTNAGAVFQEVRSLTKTDDFRERGRYLPIHVKTMADAMWEGRLALFDEAFHLSFTPKNIYNDSDALNGSSFDENTSGTTSHVKSSNGGGGGGKERSKMKLRQQSNWDAIQESFVMAFASLLKNYRKFLVFPSKDGHKGDGGTSSGGSGSRETNSKNSCGSYGGAGFRSSEFVRSEKKVLKDFFDQLVGTQMFDDFITKRLYGSGAPDVAFFDGAVHRRLQMERRRSGNGSKWPFRTRRAVSTMAEGDEPLLQSARVRMRLKTVVPPEPIGMDLNSISSSMTDATTTTTVETDTDGDEHLSVDSSSTSGTQNTKGIHTTASQIGNGSDSSAPASDRHGKKGERRQRILSSKKKTLKMEKPHYTYTSFPTVFDRELFNKPRPLPAAVLAEFNRQRENAALFRRTSADIDIVEDMKSVTDKNSNSLRVRNDMSSMSAEITTFTVFFVAYTAVVGMELSNLSINASGPADGPDDQAILATYSHESKIPEMSIDIISGSDNTLAPDINSKSESGYNYMFRQPTNDKELEVDVNVAKAGEEKESRRDHKSGYDRPRSRFTISLVELRIEEAKATARAQLGLGFEMLEMMRLRGLRTDPSAYQCLIAACGRCDDSEHATQLLARMHEDGIVADGVVYSSLVSAFSGKNSWKKTSMGSLDIRDEIVPVWANGASVEMDWNKLSTKSVMERAKLRFTSKKRDSTFNDSISTATSTKSDESGFRRRMRRMMNKNTMEVNRTLESCRISPSESYASEQYDSNLEDPDTERIVPDTINRQIIFGESILEDVYPDISIDTDNEFCPRCNSLLSDNDVVDGWTPCDSQDYTTKCAVCPQKFVPHFCVQSTSSSFLGSRGPGTPLFCERLSPWVLEKELRTVMCDQKSEERLLDPSWREDEYKNAVLWWNLVLSFMRYRIPFTFLLQGNFQQNLIAPTPDDSQE